MTAASLGVAHQRGGRLPSVAGVLKRLAEVCDRLLVAAFTIELTKKIPDGIAAVDTRRQLDLEPLHDRGQVVRVGCARGLGRGWCARGCTGNDEGQETSQHGEASAHHVRGPSVAASRTIPAGCA